MLPVSTEERLSAWYIKPAVVFAAWRSFFSFFNSLNVSVASSSSSSRLFFMERSSSKFLDDKSLSVLMFLEIPANS
jgi:hypothetical protein